MKLVNNQFVADPYCKLTNCNQYLHHNSCNPQHIKKSSVYSQRLCTKNLCPEETSLTNNLKNLRSLFCNRSYSEIMVEENLRRTKNRTRDELLFADSCVGKDFGVPIIVTYHPHLNGLNKANQTSRLAFIPAPFVSFHKTRNCQSHLI